MYTGDKMSTNLVKIENKNKKGPNDADYHYHVTLDINGKIVDLAFTDSQLYIAYKRAMKNADEKPAKKMAFGRIIDAAF
jgi:hypothetical protein